VKYMLLEKVAFQSVGDFQYTVDLVEEKGIKAWVNCNKRMFPVFVALQKKLQLETQVHLVVEGGSWHVMQFTFLICFLSLPTR